LRKWIKNPRSLRYGTIMPAYDGDVDEIIAYLKAMKEHKVAPKGH
jgi:cytochrome c2